MGLLDDFGDFIKTPEGQGLLSATFGGLAGARRGQPINSLGRAGLAGLSGYGGALERQDQLAQQADSKMLRDMQLDALKRKMTQEDKQAMEAERVRDLIAGAGQPKLGMGGTSQVNDALPLDLQIGAMAPLQEPGKIDFQALVRAGVPFDLVKQLADAQNLGKPKVARTVEVEGPNGSKMLQNQDDYGQPVGDGMNGYVAPQLIDTGDRKTFAKPMTGQSFAMGMSPSNQIAIRGQNMTDSRARDFNSISQQTNGIKLGEKEQAANLAKAGQVASFDVMLGSLDRLGKHPGLARSVGLTGAFPTMPGSESANFKAELDTFQSQAFLPMVSQLKGMGALSDAEGKKLTAAVGALNPAMGEQAFRASIDRITSDMAAARARLTGEGMGGASGSWDNKQKTVTLSDIQATARASGKTTEEVTRALRAKGYQIGGQ